MNIDEHIKMQNTSSMYKILFFSSLFIFSFSLVVFNEISFALIAASIFLILGSFLIILYLYKDFLCSYKKKILESFVPIATVIENETNGRGITEIEFDRYGAAIRVFVLDAEDGEINGLLDNVMNYLGKNNEKKLYNSLQMCSIENKGEMRNLRKILKKKIQDERNLKKDNQL